MKGIFITVEGGEGCGKSSVIFNLKSYPLVSGALFLREPGGTVLGDSIRDILQHDVSETPCPMAELLLFMASRVQLVETMIRPALESGRHVICDRYLDSSVVYQGYGRQVLPPSAILETGKMVTRSLMPDLTILLDIPVDVGFSRIGNRTLDRFERTERSFHERVREGYLILAASDPSRVKVVDASQPLDEVLSIVKQEINSVFQVFGCHMGM